MASTNWSGERAVAGVTSGLIGAGQDVTWKGRHFGLTLTHTSRITVFDRPHHFQDCMVRGAFKSFCHDHFFESSGGGTIMRDVMRFEAPLGWLGRIVELALVEGHMRSLLQSRNQYIKQIAESEEWRKYVMG